MSKLDKLKKFEEEQPKASNGKGSNLKAVIIVIIVSVVALGSLVFAMLQLSQRDEVQIDKGPNIDETSPQEQFNSIIRNALYPIDIPKFALQEYNEDLYNETFRDEVISWTMSSPLGILISGMPSLKTPLIDNDGSVSYMTNDPSKQFHENGMPNSLFSYVTQEDIAYTFGLYFNRLMLPQFGAWGGFQSSMNQAKSTPLMLNELEDMFTLDYRVSLRANTEDYSAVPILADWDEDDMSWLEPIYSTDSVGVVFGEIDNTRELKFNEIDSIYEFDVPVTYSSYTHKQNAPMTFKGNLKLTMVPNDEDTENVAYRLLISSAELTIDKDSLK